MKKARHYLVEQIDKDETLARIVLSPRDLDPVTHYPKESFITLRNAENGISFLRFDLMGRDSFVDRGQARATLYNKNRKKAKYSFAGWMEAVASEIIALAPDIITIEVNDPANTPEHVNIMFRKNGELMRGIVTDAAILDLMDELYHCLRFIKV